jgi:hypothetical protein
MPMTLDEFEKMAPTPEQLADRLVGVTKKVGAKYIIFTALHSTNRYTVQYPTELPHFLSKTKNDYIGAIIRKAHDNNIKFIPYISTVPGHYNSKGGPWFAGMTGDGKSDENKKKHVEYMLALLNEMQVRYADIGGIDGVWIDGSSKFTDMVRMKEAVGENGIVIGNNLTRFPYPGSYMAALEGANADPEPLYNRPSSHRVPRSDRFQPPLSDYCEDIPNIGNWFYQEKGHQSREDRYADNPTFWVKEMISSLGQRRKWNYATSIAPLHTGDIREKFQSSVYAMSRFMEWGSEAIYNTTGGEGAPLRQGWMNDGAFASITVSSVEDRTYYLCVTTAPDKNFRKRMKESKNLEDIPLDVENSDSRNMLIIQHYWTEVESITDLRTGEPQPFIMDGSINLTDIDWSDVQEYGAKILKIKLK